MPYGDKTGPNSQGPMTGRKQGFCIGNTYAGFEANTQLIDRGGRGFRGGHHNEPGMGRGRANARFGQRAGQGMGHGRRFSDNATPVDINSKTYIENKISALKTELERFEKALGDLNTSSN